MESKPDRVLELPAKYADHNWSSFEYCALLMKAIKVKASKQFIEAMKASVIEAKERHKKLFAQITPEMISKLKKRDDAQGRQDSL